MRTVQSRMMDQIATPGRLSPLDSPEAIGAALVEGALPGETDGFDSAARDGAGAFVAETAATRRPGAPAIALESMGGESVERRMRLAIVNDDMPFLVDSVAAALAARG